MCGSSSPYFLLKKLHVCVRMHAHLEGQVTRQAAAHRDELVFGRFGSLRSRAGHNADEGEALKKNERRMLLALIAVVH